MRYKKSIKILIDKRKLETLLRLNCPKEILINLIFENKLNLTGDSLIDDNLESLMEIKEFDNWGGKREGSGRHKKIQLENQDENQLENQDANQDEDKDKDKDIDIDNLFNKDLFLDKNIQKVISLYKEHCTNLIPIGYEHRNLDRLTEIKEFLLVVRFDFDYVIALMQKANKQRTFYKNPINLKGLIKNHDDIFAGLGASTVNQPQGNTLKSTSEIIAKVRARQEVMSNDT